MSSSVSAVTRAFQAAAAEDRAALIGYLPAGFPDKDTCVKAALAMADGGADIIEVGLPYSDPLMDGPVIAGAVYRSLAGGTRVRDVLDTVEAISRAGAATLVMTYWNPVARYGVAAFARDLASAGGSGLITPDLTPEEAGDWPQAADSHGLDRVFLVAPSSPDGRIAAIAGMCRGFVYAASVMGITGARDDLGEGAAGLVRRTREHAPGLPVAVGLGVSTPAQAAQVAGFADGVIVGSAFVRRLADAATPGEAVTATRDLSAALAAGVRGQ
jgi:tryptophan synthase alpha chain